MEKNWSDLTTYYKYPAVRWKQKQLRTKVTKGAGSTKTATVMAFNPPQESSFQEWSAVEAEGFRRFAKEFDVFFDRLDTKLLIRNMQASVDQKSQHKTIDSVDAPLRSDMESSLPALSCRSSNDSDLKARLTALAVERLCSRCPCLLDPSFA